MVFEFLRRKKELSHAELRELLSPYADRRLDAEQAAKVEDHLRSCPSCRNELESIRITQRLVQSLPSIGLPRSFTLDVAPKPAPMPRSFVYLKGATGLAAAAFVALLAIRAILPLSGISQWDGLQTETTEVHLLTGQADTQAKSAAAGSVRSAERSQAPEVQIQGAPPLPPAPTAAAAAPVAPMSAVEPTAAAEGDAPAPADAAAASAPAPAPAPAEVAPAGAAPAAAPRASAKAQAQEPAEQAVPAASPPETSVPDDPSAPTDPTDPSGQVDRSRYGLSTGEGGQQDAKTAGQAEPANAAQVGSPSQPPQLVEARPESPTKQAEIGGFSVILPGLLAVTGVLVVALAAATSVIWWRYRRPSQ